MQFSDSSDLADRHLEKHSDSLPVVHAICYYLEGAFNSDGLTHTRAHILFNDTLFVTAHIQSFGKEGIAHLRDIRKAHEADEQFVSAVWEAFAAMGVADRMC